MAENKKTNRQILVQKTQHRKLKINLVFLVTLFEIFVVIYYLLI